ncbi:hypothetical protein T439DRAFT_129323 [Meredithblackwellia eburnea MCA 4105]
MPNRTPSPERWARRHAQLPDLFKRFPNLEIILGYFDRVDVALAERYKLWDEGIQGETDILSAFDKKPSKRSGAPSELGLTDELRAHLRHIQKELAARGLGGLLTYQATGGLEKECGADIVIQIHFEHPSPNSSLSDRVILLLQAKCLRGNTIDFSYRPEKESATQALTMFTYAKHHEAAANFVPAFIVYGHTTLCVSATKVIGEAAEAKENDINNEEFKRELTREVLQAEKAHGVHKFGLSGGLAHAILARIDKMEEYKDFENSAGVTFGRRRLEGRLKKKRSWNVPDGGAPPANELGTHRHGGNGRRSARGSVFEVQARVNRW